MDKLLDVEEITKSFPGVRAVDEASLTVGRGEIVALVGENGAGKTTLSQVVGGVFRPDRGRLFIEGHAVVFDSPLDAMHAGISMVFQELSLVGSLSVAENIFANRQPTGFFNAIRWRELYEKAADFLERFEINLDPKVLVKQLGKGQQQILEILKAISAHPKLLILDEPTSALTEAETACLFDNIRALQSGGMSFLYITHKLPEVFKISSRVVVMRDGRIVGSVATAESTETRLVAMMVGREIPNVFGSTRRDDHNEEYFRVEDFSRKGLFSGVSLSVGRGEIVGLAGLVGSGRTELGRAIFGADPRDSGRLFLQGSALSISSSTDAIKAGIAYLTEDRKELGLFLNMKIRDNLVAPSLPRFTSKLGLLKNRRIEAFALERIREYSIATSSLGKKVGKLSGGNQQKCLIAMWMSIDPKVIIFDEPTRGVDVGSREEIYRKIREGALRGIGVILISSDLPELLGMCDRILVMHRGRIAGEIDRNDFSEELILSYATGLRS